MGPRLATSSAAGALVLAVVAIGAAGAGAQAIQKARSATGHTSVAGDLIAPPAACPGHDRIDAPPPVQEREMLCLVDFARRESGLPSLAPISELEFSAAHKTRDMLDCDEFSHFACDREFTYWIRISGYMSVPCWHVGENIAWGRGELGSARAIFVALIRSESHRRNLLGDYTGIGIDTRVGNLGWHGTVQVWTQHFGSQCQV
jgi:uncharacterized protein YkwD